MRCSVTCLKLNLFLKSLVGFWEVSSGSGWVAREGHVMAKQSSTTHTYIYRYVRITVGRRQKKLKTPDAEVLTWLLNDLGCGGAAQGEGGDGGGVHGRAHQHAALVVAAAVALVAVAAAAAAAGLHDGLGDGGGRVVVAVLLGPEDNTRTHIVTNPKINNKNLKILCPGGFCREHRGLWMEILFLWSPFHPYLRAVSCGSSAKSPTGLWQEEEVEERRRNSRIFFYYYFQGDFFFLVQGTEG